jgi:hypothetical protein
VRLDHLLSKEYMFSVRPVAGDARTYIPKSTTDDAAHSRDLAGPNRLMSRLRKAARCLHRSFAHIGRRRDAHAEEIFRDSFLVGSRSEPAVAYLAT